MQRSGRHLFGALILVFALAHAGAQEASKEVQIADFVLNLRTLGRLVRQATQRALT